MRYVRKLGAEFNYKYFPNGLDNRFNLYFVTNLALTNTFYESVTYYYDAISQSRNHLSLMGGSGFQIKLFGKAYIRSRFNLGAMTYSSKTVIEGGYPSYFRPMFENVYLDGVIRVNIGYRF